MDKKELDSVIKYNGHAIFMSEIALAILNNNKSILDVKGVKELIATYLLIPYITRDQLDTPSVNNNIPQLDINEVFQKAMDENGNICDITLDNLRNSICHSFLTVEDRDNGYIVIDDRAIYSDRKSHANLTKKSLCQKIDIKSAETKLKELHSRVIKEQRDFNEQLKKDNGYND